MRNSPPGAGTMYCDDGVAALGEVIDGGSLAGNVSVSARSSMRESVACVCVWLIGGRPRSACLRPDCGGGRCACVSRAHSPAARPLASGDDAAGPTVDRGGPIDADFAPDATARG